MVVFNGTSIDLPFYNVFPAIFHERIGERVFAAIPAAYAGHPVVTESRVWYDWAWTQQSDLSKEFPLMDPFWMLGFCLLYLTVVGVGRVIMSFLKPIDPKGLMMIHNIVEVVICAWIMVVTAIEGWGTMGLRWNCNNMEESPRAMNLAWIIWVFHFSKILDFSDTYFMVLRKKSKQISFLHVYHHVTIYPIWWAVSFFAPGGESYLSPILNAFIHVVLYGYYFVTSFGYKVPDLIRKNITTMQLTQFVIMFAQSITCVMTDSCTAGAGQTVYPKWLCWTLFGYMITMLTLFGNFFIQSYSKKGGKGGKAPAKGSKGSKAKKTD